MKEKYLMPECLPGFRGTDEIDSLVDYINNPLMDRDVEVGKVKQKKKRNKKQGKNKKNPLEENMDGDKSAAGSSSGQNSRREEAEPQISLTNNNESTHQNGETTTTKYVDEENNMENQKTNKTQHKNEEDEEEEQTGDVHHFLHGIDNFVTKFLQLEDQNKSLLTKLKEREDFTFRLDNRLRDEMQKNVLLEGTIKSMEKKHQTELVSLQNINTCLNRKLNSLKSLCRDQDELVSKIKQVVDCSNEKNSGSGDAEQKKRVEGTELDENIPQNSIEQVNLIEFQQLKKFSTSDKIFPRVKRSADHTFAILLTDNFEEGDYFDPFPSKFISTWDENFVPLPCNKQNIQIVKKIVYKAEVESEEEEEDEQNTSNDEQIHLTKVEISQWDRIVSALGSKKFKLSLAMKSYAKDVGDLNILQDCVVKLSPEEKSRFFSQVLPGMIDLCLNPPNILTCPLPLLLKSMNHSITLSQKQIACLLANAFFCTFPQRLKNEDEFPGINFNNLLSGDGITKHKAQKLLCILHYFDRVISKMPNGLVTFTRRSLKDSNLPVWEKSDKSIRKLITLNKGTIETEGQRFLQIDFANKFVGGGCLRNGAVQEEILFMIYPELITSLLFTEKLGDTEALIVTGCERFSKYKGYSHSFRFDGDFIDKTPRDKTARKCTQIIAIDALKFQKTEENLQFHPKQLERELNKAYTGFSRPIPYSTDSSAVAVATGKWGCGVFGGDAHLKAVIQLMAASEIGRDVIFFTFGDSRLQIELQEIYSVIKDKTTRDVMNLLHLYHRLYCDSPDTKRTVNLHEFIVKLTKEKEAIDLLLTKTAEIPKSSNPHENDATVLKGDGDSMKEDKNLAIDLQCAENLNDSTIKSTPKGKDGEKEGSQENDENIPICKQTGLKRQLFSLSYYLD